MLLNTASRLGEDDVYRPVSRDDSVVQAWA